MSLRGWKPLLSVSLKTSQSQSLDVSVAPPLGPSYLGCCSMCSRRSRLVARRRQHLCGLSCPSSGEEPAQHRGTLFSGCIATCRIIMQQLTWKQSDGRHAGVRGMINRSPCGAVRGHRSRKRIFVAGRFAAAGGATGAAALLAGLCLRVVPALRGNACQLR